jgi:uncharacterized protein YdeI (YjbR/CyaY-like superfamily)
VAGTTDLPVIAFKTPKELERWLRTNHAKSEGIWLNFAKKDSGIPSVTYLEALDVALCYGWIDGQAKPFDASSWLQRFTPRRARSRWSQRNTEKAEALIAAGRMAPAGMAQVKAAQADGRWAAAYDRQSSAQVPPELEKALRNNAKARAFFATLRGVNRYALVYRIQVAKKPETKERLAAKFAAMLAKCETFYP